MKICGIVAEYNPFHNGHEYHIGKAKELTGSDFVVVCMSGNFVQRGIPAICDKYLRAEAALKGGADLVIELPTVYATASAENFAFGAVSLLDKIGCDSICFGAECADINRLRHTASLYDAVESEHIDEIISLKKDGLSHVQVIQKIASDIDSAIGDLCFESNDRLGIAYIRAGNVINKNIEFYCIKRNAGAYLDISLESQSAMAIRNSIINNEEPGKIKSAMPIYSYELMFKDVGNKFIEMDDFSDALYMKLLSIKQNCRDEATFRNRLEDYYDVSGNIAGRIVNLLENFTNTSDFAKRLHTSEYTMSRIYRSLTHILLNILETDVTYFSENNISYIRILGMKKSAGFDFSRIKPSVKIISKLADAREKLSDDEMKLLNIDINSSDLYEHIKARMENRESVCEYRRKIVNCS